MTRRHDSLRTVLAAILPATIAGTPITVQPAFVQGMTDFHRLSEAQAGYIASAEVTGLMVATVIFAFVSRRLPWRRAYALGLLVMVIGNLVSIFANTPEMLAVCRIVTGIGAGLVTAIGFAAIAETRDPTRNFGWMVASIIGYSAVVLLLMPTLFDLGGYDALLIGYALVSLLCLPLVPSLAHRDTASASVDHAHSRDVRLLSWRGMFGVLSVLVFFVGYAAAWTYMALVGRQAGLPDRQVAYALSISQLFGVAGAMTIVILARRVSDRTQAVGVLSIGAAGIAAFAMHQNYITFLALNCLFQFAWNAGQPLLLGINASGDRSGALLRIAIPLQYVGLAAGPALAALMVDLRYDYGIVMLVASVIALTSLLCILPILFGIRPPTDEVDGVEWRHDETNEPSAAASS